MVAYLDCFGVPAESCCGGFCLMVATGMLFVVLL